MGESLIDPDTGHEFCLHVPDRSTNQDDLVLILNLHGGRSFRRWQDGYFPAYRLADRFGIVVATPTLSKAQLTTGPVRESEDRHLHNIVDIVVDRFGRERLRSFWLAGHSRGSFACYRLLRTTSFAEYVDGWLSLSGGRLGWPEATVSGSRSDSSGDDESRHAPATRRLSLPDVELSFIYVVGEHEIRSLPERSLWAERYGAGPRRKLMDVVDDQPGRVYDYSVDTSSREWGGRPRSGTAHVYVYPTARDGRVIADIVRVDKGHTEGLEPKITEAVVELMVSAPGGKLRRSQLRNQQAQ